MSESFTPGPWKVLRNGKLWKVGQPLNGGTHYLAADIPDRETADLIAAAPDLLAESSRALAWLERLSRIAPEHDNLEVTGRLRAAIAKAEGKA